MRYSPSHLARTRQRILRSARQLFATRGYAATSIDTVMADCGLTRGGFYRHFRSKAELYAQALGRDDHSTRQPPARHWLETRFEAWLHERPLASLAADAAHGTPAVRAAARQRWNDFVDELRAQLADEPGGADETQLQAATALVVGALALAQGQHEPPQRRRWLAACRLGMQRLLDEPADDQFFWALPMREDGRRPVG